MNDDHSDAVLLYAQVLGGHPQATAATMRSIDAEGMNLDVHTPGATLPSRIPFDHVLADAEDAHHTLIAMVKQARSQLTKPS
jgi:putative heme iron utilization protein